MTAPGGATGPTAREQRVWRLLVGGQLVVLGFVLALVVVSLLVGVLGIGVFGSRGL